MAFSFATSSPYEKHSPGRRTYTCITIWPFAVVSLCIALDNFNMPNFKYWSEEVCSLDSGFALIFGFGLPIGVIISVNAVCFVTTATKIYIDRQKCVFQGHYVSDIPLVKIFTKIFVLIGLTWIFGFLANVDKLFFFNYIFVIVNSVQGVFIFVSFIRIKNVLNC